ncbi:autotransporter assembly complex protein TamA [Ramlibacter sp. PS4R-6]|uniref:autotransporter assembly complex protein TamA n=1 Tax=Ramlibacter sp. PS4R-6 TaxID=3133438 RepID=UPI00309B895F
MRLACFLFLVAFFAAAHAQEAQGPSFTIDVRAPRELKRLLERDMELRRYREVADLDDAELARLVSSAERNARELVATQGYFDPKIVVRREGAGTGKPVIVVEVEPGRLTHAADTKIEFEGAIAESADKENLAQRDEIERGWRLPRGHAFTQEDWDDAKTHALRQMIQRRYPAGRISYSLADVDAATATANLGLRLDSGPLFRLGAMQVTGMRRYDPVLVPRLARLAPGTVYDQDEIVQAQLRLTGSGYFDTAFIYVDPQGDPKAAPVEVTVREAELHRIVFGPGVSTDSGARLSLEYRNNRVPGIGWQAVAKAQLERKAPFIEAEMKAIPRESGWRWGVLARAERTDDGTLLTHAQRYRVGQTWAGGHIERNVYVQYERATVQASPGVSTASIPDNGDGEAVSVNYVWTGRYFDRMPYPTRGYGLATELGGGITLNGSKSPFSRTVVRWLGIRPLPDGRLQLRAEAGAVIAKPDARVPSTQMFRTGGDTTVRGYGYREIGVDRNGIVAPGRYEAVASIEWQKPIRRAGVETNFEGVTFVDTGAVADRVHNLRPVYGAGVGVRYKSPLGPLEGALAYGFKPKKLRLHFSIGMTF